MTATGAPQGDPARPGDRSSNDASPGPGHAPERGPGLEGREGRPDGPRGDDSDWTDQVTDLIVDSVDKVRARTTGPVLNVAHAAVYGVVAAIVAIPVIVVLMAGFIRFLNWLVPGDIWITYMIVAALMWACGAILWSMREGGDSSEG